MQIKEIKVHNQPPFYKNKIHTEYSSDSLLPLSLFCFRYPWFFDPALRAKMKDMQQMSRLSLS